ncbi:hypothetical protein M422DRAFT_26216 [Sphaerobolus stellatus SS14]|nr:hypothetical protein M422DRAFT_26216 [Sphaerobolus stellatus SS14]
MPVPTAVQPLKNIWVAAGEGDLDRVRELVENESFSPNTPDDYTYTPMHAAASYGQIDVLEYLVSKGGDVNIKDEDNETPLFTVESVEVARWLVEHGADIHCCNAEGSFAAQHLAEEFPAVSNYLYSLDPSMIPTEPANFPQQPSNYATDQAATDMTQSILTGAQAIIERAEAEDRDPESELREMVGRVVLGGVLTGASLAQDSSMEETVDANANGRRQSDQDGHTDSAKRPRFGDESG